MRFEPTPIADVWVIGPEPQFDERGFFARMFCMDEFAAHGLVATFAQDSIALNHRAGTVRGMHFSRAPHTEIKLIRCVRGSIFDVIVDLRPDSPTYRTAFTRILNDVDRESIYIGGGMAHGYQTLTDDTEVSYRIDIPYAAGSAAGIRYDDPQLAIAWPLPVSVLSDRDRSLPLLVESSAR